MDADIKEVIAKVQKLYRIDGYFDRFDEICQENPCNTNKANYHLLELEFISLFNQPRYADFDSFRQTRYKRQTKKLKKFTSINN